ncbi:MAG: NADH-quinone oxidoreductase subunit A [Bacteriovoracaceae bacterium]|nr:NADH-quinone oxidoreductase subunit A [Bacteriovoracaceae bacterium]
MEINYNLIATVVTVAISTVTLLFVFLLKKKRKSDGVAEIFECGENPIGSATRQYRVDFIFSMISDVLLMLIAMVLFYWVVNLVETDSKISLIGTTVTSVIWLITYLYTISIGVKEK